MTRVARHRLDPAYYPIKVRILARFADVDPLWHVNNVAIAQYYEEARVAASREMQEGMRFADPSAQRVLIAHQSIDYLREAGYPGELEIGVGVLRIGTSSYTFGMGMFQHGECASVSDAVMVFADPAGPIRIPDQARRRLEAWLLRADDAT